MLYPLLFEPIVKPKIWGRETWLLSGYGDDLSVVNNGFLAGNNLSEVLEIYMDELAGGKVYDQFGTFFPLLFKIIDAKDDLSVQVHPNDEQAGEMMEDNDVRPMGKTEMWVVTKAEEDASIVLGFAHKTNETELKRSLEDNSIMDLLQVVHVKKDDAALITAGTVHALRKGTQVVEIQETSDITYRLYDYNRLGMDGKLRELHIPQAMKVLKYDATPQPLIDVKEKGAVTNLVRDTHFTTNRLRIKGTLQRDYARYDSFVVYVCLNGEAEIEYEEGKMTLKEQQTCLIPACLPDIKIVTRSGCDILETLITE